MMHVELQKTRARVDLEHLRPGAVGTFPEDTLAHPGIDFKRSDVLAFNMDDLAHSA
jgi:hypothetical protein